MHESIERPDVLERHEVVLYSHKLFHTREVPAKLADFFIQEPGHVLPDIRDQLLGGRGHAVGGEQVREQTAGGVPLLAREQRLAVGHVPHVKLVPVLKAQIAERCVLEAQDAPAEVREVQLGSPQRRLVALIPLQGAPLSMLRVLRAAPVFAEEARDLQDHPGHVQEQLLLFGTFCRGF